MDIIDIKFSEVDAKHISYSLYHRGHLGNVMKFKKGTTIYESYMGYEEIECLLPAKKRSFR